jgi:hypothetical protein
MRITKLSAALALGVAALGLSACATSLNTRVTRYQAMPAPQGQTFAVVPGEGMARMGGLEFQHYASIVAQQLGARGYRWVGSPQGANMIVQLGYGVDGGQVHVTSYGPYGYGGYGPYGFGSYWGRGRFSRLGYWGSPFYYGWNDPFWYGGGIDSYVEYHSQLDVHIRQAGTNAPLFDGRVQARSETNRLDALVPSLIEALFTGFPGQNGETVKITIPARQSGQASSY